MRGTLRKLEPIIAPEVEPEGAEPAGFTPNGKHRLWKRIRRMVRVEPQRDAQGEQEWLRNANGDRVVRKYKAVPYDEEQLFYTEPGLNNERYEIAYVPPTAEQLAAERRAKLVKELGGNRLAEMIVDTALKSGVTPDALVADLLAGRRAAGIEATPQEVESTFQPLPEPELPKKPLVLGELKHRGGPHWTLGDGSKLTGSREEAEAAQKALEEVWASEIPDF